MPDESSPGWSTRSGAVLLRIFLVEASSGGDPSLVEADGTDVAGVAVVVGPMVVVVVSTAVVVVEGVAMAPNSPCTRIGISRSSS